MTRDTAVDLVGGAALGVTLILLLWLPAILQI